MRTAAVLILLFSALAAVASYAQTPSPESESPTPAPKKTDKAVTEKSDKSGIAKLFGSNPAGLNHATTTEIYADEAFFDSNKSMGVFSGHVKVADPRFNIQADKLTVFISKGEKQGLEKAVAEGNVAVVRDRPDRNGGAPTRTAGRSESATYTAATGDVELKGTPRVQQGLNTHIATSPETVMVINQNGQLATHGPSRTDIRQGIKDELKEEAEGETKPSVSPKP
jgi:lipopolysaccharide transport protein LptA